MLERELFFHSIGLQIDIFMYISPQHTYKIAPIMNVFAPDDVSHIYKIQSRR